MTIRGCVWGCLAEVVIVAIAGAAIVAVWTFAPFVFDAARRALS